MQAEEDWDTFLDEDYKFGSYDEKLLNSEETRKPPSCIHIWGGDALMWDGYDDLTILAGARMRELPTQLPSITFTRMKHEKFRPEMNVFFYLESKPECIYRVDISFETSSSLSSLYEARAAIGDQDPTLLRPEHASMNRFWCVFCDSDIDELGSSFACGNSINHMASADHLKNCKSLKGWEKKCKPLKNETPSEGSHSALIGPLNDIHNELNSEYTDSFDKNNIHSLNSSCSNSVVPLQNYTTERYQIPGCHNPIGTTVPSDSDLYCLLLFV
ncbi:unnamed protein product [Ilex paraguariensis]|uniref:Uncharacterized protein n=1 Tax=Ilex paraguariensis TaxID=185542 RepID=A0ABC8TXY3_9AQUA